MALIGNTIRLKASFTDWDGNPASPTGVVLRFYDSRRRKIGEDITVEPVTAGQYQHDYEVESDSVFYFEFSGILEGNAVAGRSVISKKWLG